MVSQLHRQYTWKYNFFNVRLALWEVWNVILKLEFTPAFGATVNGDAKNIMYREFAMYLFSFFVEIKKLCDYQVQVEMHNLLFFFNLPLPKGGGYHPLKDYFPAR